MPRSTMVNIFYRSNANMKHFCNPSMRNALRPEFAYAYNIFFGQFCIGLSTPARHSSLGVAVGGIFLRRAQKQMTWITASWIIARMANLLSTWVNTVGEQIGKPMGQNVFSLFNRKICIASIPFGVGTICPAFIIAALYNITPKAFGEGLSKIDSCHISPPTESPRWAGGCLSRANRTLTHWGDWNAKTKTAEQIRLFALDNLIVSRQVNCFREVNA